jgi:hypothetical protein
MADHTACASRWDEIRASFERHWDELAVSYLDAVEEIGLIQTALIKIGQPIRSSTPYNGNGAVWKRLTAQAESERAVLCKHLDGKPMLTAMRWLYAATFREMAETAFQETAQLSEEFREQKRRKRFPSDDRALALHAKKKSITALQPAKPHAPTRNFYTPLRNTMEVEEWQDGTGTDAEKQSASSQAGRPPPIILTSATNLIQLQKEIRGLVEGTLSSATPGVGPKLSQRIWLTSQP